MVVGEYYNGSIVCVPCEQEDGLLSGLVIKPGMETGNEMERNEINLQCSGGYSLRNIL